MTSPLGEWVPIDALRRWARNPRKNDGAPVERVAESIRRFGFVAPVVVWTSQRRVVAGHTRLKAMERLLAEDATFVPRGAPAAALVPVRYHEFASETDADLYAIADNRLAELAAWDEQALAALLTELGALDAKGVQIAYGSAEEVEALLDSLEAADHAAAAIAGEDPGPDPIPENPVSEVGATYELGAHRLVCGDSTDSAIVRAAAADGVQLVWTDPPYNVAYQGGTAERLTIQNDSMSDTAFAELLRGMFTAAIEVTDPGAGIYIAHADTSGHLFRNSMLEAGWLLKQCLVWVKDQFVLGRQDYHWRHEPILYGWKPGAAHRWYGDRAQSTVLEFDRPRRSTEHPTMKPVDLIEYCLGNSTQPGDAVFDGCGGSGSTLIAAARTGRRARLVELDPRYCDVIRRRWTQFARSAGADPGAGALE